MPKSTQIQNKIASNLDQIAELLNQKGLVQSTSPLYRAAQQCRSQIGENWGYRIDRLIFHRIGEIRVQSHKTSNISLEVSVDIEGVCDFGPEKDPLTKLSFDLSILSNDANDGYPTPMSAWHLDRHTEESNFLHPTYHFQFGGKRMKQELKQYGTVLISDAPRIPHPPMDGILGIDFLLVNFWEVNNIVFRNEGKYRNILNDSITMLWKPYIENLYGYWQQNAQLLQWKPHLNWHQLPAKDI